VTSLYRLWRLCPSCCLAIAVLALSGSCWAEQAASEPSAASLSAVKDDVVQVRQSLARLETQVKALADRVGDLARRLERLETATPHLPGPPDAQVTLLGTPGPRREGDPLHVRVTVNRACYLSVFNIDPHGEITVLYPLDPRTDNFVAQGGTFDFPSSGTAWRVGPPFGANTIKVVAALIKWPVTKDMAEDQGLPLIGSGEATISYEAVPRR
jgi:hypothetical protein